MNHGVSIERLRRSIRIAVRNLAHESHREGSRTSTTAALLREIGCKRHSRNAEDGMIHQPQNVTL